MSCAFDILEKSDQIMPNTFTTTTTTGYGTRIGKSIGGALAGVLLFFGSFVLLYMNEGRTDLSKIAKTAIELPASGVDATAEGRLVSGSGVVTSAETLGDAVYLRDGKYLAIDRSVEMYAWVEKVTEKSQTNVGGSETTTTTYDYVMEWTDGPMSASEMQYPDEHINPVLSIESESFTVGTLTVGTLDVAGTVDLPSTERLTLTKDLVSLSDDETLSGNYVFYGTGTMTSPKLGDIRVSYSVLQPGFDGTVFGELSGDKVTKFTNEDGDSVFRVFEGSREGGIAMLHDEYVTMGWILRVVGFLMMWIGLTSVLGPLATLLDVLPFLGSTTRFMVGVVTFPIALVLTIVTVLVSMILHSLVALIVVVLLAIGGGIAAAKMMSKKMVGAV
jgi:hypothetical protein